MSKARDVVVRKFLHKNPLYPETISWSVESYDYKTTALDITLGGQGETFSIRVHKRDKTPSVSAALAPINALIAELSKAAIAFAKACNVAEAQDRVEDVSNKEVMKKKVKSSAALKK